MYENGALHSVALDVSRARHELARAHRDAEERPDVVIYMREDFWRECMSQKGEVSAETYEFICSRGAAEGQTFYGAPVYRVISNDHPKYKVMVDVD